MPKDTTSPTPAHKSSRHPDRHVDIKGVDGKVHHAVKNDLGATAIGGLVRDSARKEKGR